MGGASTASIPTGDLVQSQHRGRRREHVLKASALNCCSRCSPLQVSQAQATGKVPKQVRQPPSIASPATQCKCTCVFSPAEEDANAASLASRTRCFMRPCNACTVRPLASGTWGNALAQKSTQAHVSKYTMTFSCRCACKVEQTDQI